MNANVKRKSPEELVSKAQRHPLSTRVRVETYEILEKIAKDVGTSLSDLSAGILDDYVQWYQTERKVTVKKSERNKN